jgi:hypothetical protein
MGWVTDVGVGVGVAVNVGVIVTSPVFVGVGVALDMACASCFTMTGRYKGKVSDDWALAIIIPPPDNKIAETSKTRM